MTSGFTAATVDTDDIFFGMTNMMQTFNPIVVECNEAVLAAWELMKDYTDSYTRVLDYTDQFAYNFGSMYTTILRLIEDWNDGLYFNAGFSMGNMIYMTFFTYTGPVGE
jgi:hypothetical protein